MEEKMAVHQITSEEVKTLDNINLSEMNLEALPKKRRGFLIAEVKNVKEVGRGWNVPWLLRKEIRQVRSNKTKFECNCSDYKKSERKCEHIFAVEYFIKKTRKKKKKKTYTQNWPIYNKFQTNEKFLFLHLLWELCKTIEEPTQSEQGRPTLPFKDMVFSSAYKVYSLKSTRRFMSDLKTIYSMNFLEKIPSHNSIINFLQKKELTSILYDLIALSATPLATVEESFAVDSTGFSTNRFGRWYDFKYDKMEKYRVWLKLHALAGTKTHIITACKVTEGTKGDSPYLKPLVNKAVKSFDIKELSGDKAYSSRANLEFIAMKAKAVPYIPFRRNSTTRAGGSAVWRKMYCFFLQNYEYCQERYHRRSNVESTFNMIKTKFGDSLRSKKKRAQTNELLLKVLIHNICVVANEVLELGISAQFLPKKS